MEGELYPGIDTPALLIDLDRLGFSPDNIASFNRLITRPHGIICFQPISINWS